MTFKVGYFEGSKNTKMSIVSKDDITDLYSKFSSGEIMLWCEGRGQEPGEFGRGKRKREQQVCKNFEKEEEVDKVSDDLMKKHGDDYDTPRLRLWARMIIANLHDSLEEPPNIPAFHSLVKKAKRESLSNAFSGAAVAFANALNRNGSSNSTQSSGTPNCTFNTSHTSSIFPNSMSPGKAAQLRKMNLEQLRYIRQLFNDEILTKEEYDEQKENILSAIRKL